MLTIYGRRSSFNLQKVTWLAAELDLDFEHVELGGSFGGLQTREFLAMNPHGKVPVIDHDGVIVWESHAILRYLAGRFPSGALNRDDLVACAADDQWMDWSHTRVQPDFLMGVFWGFYRTPAAERDTVAVERSVRACGRYFTLLDQMLSGQDYLLGAELRLPDIALGCCLYRYFNLEIERPALPNVHKWYERLCARPGYQTHVMVPFDELFGRLDF